VFVIPFELKAEPLPVKIQQGGQGEVKVTATRHPLSGPIVFGGQEPAVGVTARR